MRAATAVSIAVVGLALVFLATLRLFLWTPLFFSRRRRMAVYTGFSLSKAHDMLFAMGSLLVSFLGGRQGAWRVERMNAVTGAPLDTVERLAVMEGVLSPLPDVVWMLRGVTSYERYVNRREHEELAAIQESLARPGSTRAALIPIQKSDAWWALPQDERRAIFEDSSRHIAMGLEYLPAVARRLHHGRDLGEPFDFLTWFEYAPEDADRFEELVTRLRATEEWSYVVRETDIRLRQDDRNDHLAS